MLAVEGSLDVPRRSSRTLRVTWHATGPGALCEALRWRMTDGARQARLEVRLQGTATDPPLPAKAGARASGAAASLRPGPIASTSGSMGPPSSRPAAPAGKVPPRALSLVRPQVPVAAAPQLANGSSASSGGEAVPAQPAPAASAPASAAAAPAAAPTAVPAASKAPYPGVPRTSGMLDPSALSAAANVKLPATPLAASPLLNNGGRAPVRLVTPHRAGAGSPNVRGVALAADGGGRTLDFRRVG